MILRSRLATTALFTALTTLATAGGALAQQSASGVACGGDLAAFLQGVKAEAVAAGASASAADQALTGAQIDQKVLARDRAQGVFKQTFTEFSSRTVSKGRLDQGKQKLQQYADVFRRAEQEYGVAPGVIAAFWAMETDFGAVQGDFNTRNALVTLAHDCRRPELFRPQLLALIKMVEHGDLDPATNTGAWAGEIGQVQMLPKDIVAFGVDGDGDGHVRLKTSSPDAIMTAAKFIQHLGFKQGQPWLQEVTVPENLPWEKTGFDAGMKAGDWFKLGVKPRDGDTKFADLEGELLLPQGRKGPAFMAYPNFNIYLEWNKSFIYTTSAAYFATRLMGAEAYLKGNPEQGLTDVQMKELQTKLKAKGYDVGEIDGILGGGTRDAVQKEQQKRNIPADGWPTPELLSAL
ncbi:lytic murein transglycosylase [Rhizobium paknamense]|uniref:Lytic murein transglycosylase n=1 Tax=Rhizobium paknamense TaxID=1206817 RepID=A0ABU0I961_9HYPH|nr:lytic murein transglycosylase [Rhizobium paknamense]MDQ0454773.1 lytic murein transglycosylase [Rhizobium paknamense]